MQNFRALGARPPDPKSAPHYEFLATRLAEGEYKLRLVASEEGRLKNVLPLPFCALYNGKLVGKLSHQKKS